ncbi:MAG: hypothetical protein DRJ52_00505 [Thermoprotei archaeon]|nr:MAG: hypothetical protein DRJ52_00505 [Thermoprotei archaeon]RLF00500.1 MAG: hypothetical protein DRJ63_02325 [Thermoprotei archaeon]HDI74802.1 hypothetical protein [Thermoprotei archaeon]
MLARIIVILSGDFPQIGLDELKAIFEAYNIDSEMKIVNKRVIKVATRVKDLNYLKKILKRLAFMKMAVLELATTKIQSTREAEMRGLDLSILSKHLRGKSSFAVRALVFNSNLSKIYLEREIGRVVKEKTGTKVNLRRPDVIVQCIAYGNCLSIGIGICESIRSELFSRKAKYRPFFHPCTLHPVIARAMVNLARVRESMVVLDPFVGSGSILIEAAILGCQCIGIDIASKMCYGCVKNLKHYGLYCDSHVIRADTFLFPLRVEETVDAIVTDPPYGRLSSLKGRSHRDIVLKLFELALTSLKKNRYICFLSTLSSEDLRELACKIGIKIKGIYLIPVHNNLCRRLLVGMKHE